MSQLESLVMEQAPVLPPKVMIYGPPGIGKSTFGAAGPKPIFLQTEDGLAGIRAPCFPLAKSVGVVSEYLQCLIDDPHDYRSLVLDSTSGMELLLKKQVLLETGAPNLNLVGKWGLGYTMVAEKWEQIISILDVLRIQREMLILIVAHAEIDNAEDAEFGTFDRWAPKISKKARGQLVEWCDLVGYATRRMVLRSVDNGKTTIAAGIGPDGGDRILNVCGSPAILAKNRYGLTGELPLAWEPLYQAFSQRVSE
jgi:hypothetical protein